MCTLEPKIQGEIMCEKNLVKPVSAPKAVPAKATAGYENTNTNTLTVNVPACQQAVGDTTAETQTTTGFHPPPDQKSFSDASVWVTPICTMIVAAIAGWISWQTKKKDLRIKRAEFRHGWMIELRDACSEIIAKSTLINLYVTVEKDELEKDLISALEGIDKAAARVWLLLDPQKDYTKEMRAIMNEITQAAMDNNPKAVVESVKKFKTIANKILEKGWQDINREVDGEKSGSNGRNGK